jgi:hypothetical protein
MELEAGHPFFIRFHPFFIRYALGQDDGGGWSFLNKKTHLEKQEIARNPPHVGAVGFAVFPQANLLLRQNPKMLEQLG